MKCPQCNANIRDDLIECPHCGKEFLDTTTEASSPEEERIKGRQDSSPYGEEADLDEQLTYARGAGEEDKPQRSVGDDTTKKGPGAGEQSFRKGESPVTARYELQEKLGVGGFAEVYKAWDKNLGRTVAIKRLRAEKMAESESAKAIRRFESEAYKIASVDHSNIVRVFEIGQDADGYWIAMEYVEGGTLKDYLRDRGSLSVEESVQLLLEICRGVRHAHWNNLIHRDIKPANILLRWEPDRIVPKLSDFGLARAGAGSDVSVAGAGMGSEGYMSPEQRQDAKNVNHTTDIYSLGKILYVMLTGDPPHDVHPGRIPSPPKISEIIYKCIETRPEDRYDTCKDLQQDLDAVLKSTFDTASGIVCPYCMQHNPDDANNCQQCGQSLYQVCPHCHQQQKAGVSHCMGCGFDFQAAEQIRQNLEEAQTRLDKKDYTSALSSVKAVLDAEPDNEKAQDIQKKASQAQERIEALEAEISQAEDDEEYEQVEQSLQRLRSLVPDEQLSAIDERLSALPEKIKQRDLQQYREKARETFSAENYDTALQHVDSALELMPDDTELAEFREQITFKINESKAAEQLKQAEQAIDKGDYEGADKLCAEVLGLFPGSVQALELRHKADDNRKKAQALNEEIDSAEQDGELQTAIEKLDELRELQPANEEVAERREKLAETQEQYAEFTRQAAHYETVGQYKPAWHAWQNAYELVPGSSEAADKVPECYRKYRDAVRRRVKRGIIAVSTILVLALLAFSILAVVNKQKRMKLVDRMREELREEEYEKLVQTANIYTGVASRPWAFLVNTGEVTEILKESVAPAYEQRKYGAVLHITDYVKAQLEGLPDKLSESRREADERLDQIEEHLTQGKKALKQNNSGTAKEHFQKVLGLQSFNKKAKKGVADAKSRIEDSKDLSDQAEQHFSQCKKKIDEVSLPLRENSSGSANNSEIKEVCRAVFSAVKNSPETGVPALKDLKETLKALYTKHKELPENLQNNAEQLEDAAEFVENRKCQTARDTLQTVTSEAKRIRQSASEAETKVLLVGDLTEALEELARTTDCRHCESAEAKIKKALAKNAENQDAVALKEAINEQQKSLRSSVTSAQNLFKEYELSQMRDSFSDAEDASTDQKEQAQEKLQTVEDYIARSQEKLRRAREKFKNKKWNEVRNLCNEALALNQKNEDAEELRKQANEKIEKSKKRLNDAETALANRRPQKAKKEVIEYKDLNAPPFSERAEGFEKKAKQFIEEAEKLSKKAKNAKENHEWCACRSYAEKALEKDRENKQAEELFSEAKDALASIESHLRSGAEALENNACTSAQKEFGDSLELLGVDNPDEPEREHSETSSRIEEKEVSDLIDAALETAYDNKNGCGEYLKRAEKAAAKGWQFAQYAIRKADALADEAENAFNAYRYALTMEKAKGALQFDRANPEANEWKQKAQKRIPKGWGWQRKKLRCMLPEGGKKERQITVFTNPLGMEFVLIEPGTFRMGSQQGGKEEKPMHEVTIDQPFYMSTREVTQNIYEDIMGDTPSRYPGENKPVENVSWFEALRFCKKLQEQTEADDIDYRLPTEAEWEYACRAGSQTPYATGTEISDKQANINPDYPQQPAQQTMPVGSFAPNAWGLYNMHGNVAEWCQSLKRPYPYDRSDGREELSKPGERVVRGGSWYTGDKTARSGARKGRSRNAKNGETGFRIVVVLAEKFQRRDGQAK